MTSLLLVSLALVLASLQLGANAHHDALERSPLVHHIHEAQRKLNSLPAHCSAGTTELILAEETRLTELLDACSKRTIVFHITELLTDTVYFGFNFYNHGVTLLSDFKDCTKEKCVFEKLFCALEKSPGAAKSAVELAFSTIIYVQQLKGSLSEIKSEINECKNSTINEYQHFLDGVVRKAVMC